MRLPDAASLLAILSEWDTMPSIHDLVATIRDVGQYEPDAMITLTLRSDEEKWAQLLPEKVNLYFPFDQEPRGVVRALGLPGADEAVAGLWVAELFAEFETLRMSDDRLSAFLTAYLSTVCGTANIGEYDVTFGVAERGKIEADSAAEFVRKIVDS